MNTTNQNNPERITPQPGGKIQMPSSPPSPRFTLTVIGMLIAAAVIIFTFAMT